MYIHARTHPLKDLHVAQHQPIYTIGKRGTEADFKVGMEELHGAEVEIVPRGGETTFHGPGQVGRTGAERPSHLTRGVPHASHRAKLDSPVVSVFPPSCRSIDAVPHTL